MNKLLIALVSAFTVLAASAATPTPAAAPSVAAPIAAAAPVSATKEVAPAHDQKKMKTVKHPAKKVLAKKKKPLETAPEATKG